MKKRTKFIALMALFAMLMGLSAALAGCVPLLDIDEHEHRLVFVQETASTCAMEGNIAHWKCETCGNYYTDDTAEHRLLESDIRTKKSTEHTLGELIGRVEATCEQAGVTAHYDCSVCEQHIAEDEKTVLTDEELEIEALGHQFAGEWTVEDGFHWHICEHDGCDTKDSYGAHEGVTVKGRDATCTEPGLTDGEECAECGETLKEQTDIPVIAHTIGARVPEKYATYDEAGHISHYTCESCGKFFEDSEGKILLSEDEVIIPQLVDLPSDEGTLLDHIFEAETLGVIGTSSNGSTNWGHLCAGESLFFNTAFSGNIALRNYSKTTLLLTVESDKDVRITVEMRISNTRGATSLAGNALSDYFTIGLKNGLRLYEVNLSETVIPEGGTQIGNNFFTMVTVSFEMNLYEGTNEITIVAPAAPTNLDFINLRTSATLGENQKAFNWFEDDGKSYAIVSKVPTQSATGTIKFGCVDAHQNLEFTLPALTDPIYEKTTESGVDTYWLTLAGSRIKVAPGATTVDGKSTFDGKLNFASGGIARYDNGGLYEYDSSGKYNGQHWKVEQNAVTINGESAALISSVNVSSVTFSSETTNTGAAFRILTGYQRDNTVADEHTYTFTFTFRNYSEKSLSFEVYLRGTGSDKSTVNAAAVSLAPYGQEGDQMTYTVVWTDNNTKSDTNVLTYFRNFAYDGVKIDADAKDNLEQFVGAKFGVLAYVEKDK